MDTGPLARQLAGHAAVPWFVGVRPGFDERELIRDVIPVMEDPDLFDWLAQGAPDLEPGRTLNLLAVGERAELVRFVEHHSRLKRHGLYKLGTRPGQQQLIRAMEMRDPEVHPSLGGRLPRGL